MQAIRHEVVMRPGNTLGPRDFRSAGKTGQGIIDANRKTEICRHWRTGACPFGVKCAFAHGMEELRPQPVDTEYNVNDRTGSEVHHFPYVQAAATEPSCSYISRCTADHNRSPPRTDNSWVQRASSDSRLYSYSYDSNDEADKVWPQNQRHSDGMMRNLSPQPSSSFYRTSPERFRVDQRQTDGRFCQGLWQSQDTFFPSGKVVPLDDCSGYHSAEDSSPIDDPVSLHTGLHSYHPPSAVHRGSISRDTSPTPPAPSSTVIATSTATGWDSTTYDTQFFEGGGSSLPFNFGTPEESPSTAAFSRSITPGTVDDISSSSTFSAWLGPSQSVPLSDVESLQWYPTPSPSERSVPVDKTCSLGTAALSSVFSSSCSMSRNSTATESLSPISATCVGEPPAPYKLSSRPSPKDDTFPGDDLIAAGFPAFAWVWDS